MSQTLLQFGGGNFLRAFVDLFLHEANTAEDAHGRAVVVTSTDSPRTRLINEQNGCYHVALRGVAHGGTVDDTVAVTRSLSHSLSAKSDWARVLELARSPDLRWIVSNTTEAGFALNPDDSAETFGAAVNPSVATAPCSFPAKLLAVLAHRLAAGEPTVAILPCELVEDNGPVLLDLMRAQADIWQLPHDLIEAIGRCPLPATLVDRIVSGRPDAHPLLPRDPLLTAAEPYASWVIEAVPGLELFPHTAITMADDVSEYALRKVRLLNGAHTALVCRAMPMGLETVGDAMDNPDIQQWLRQLLFDEILPVLEGRIVDGDGFAEAALERFANPFLQHRLTDIALQHDAKVSTRLLPTYHEHLEKFGQPPALLTEILLPYLQAKSEIL